MKAIVGIGNSGEKYAGTRHNIGFEVVETLQRRSAAAASETPPKWESRAELNAVICETRGTVFVKPSTFVNNTGDAVLALRGVYPTLGPQGVLFVSDDVNLDFGKLRLRDSGSAGGHHGLESAIDALGSEDFPRLRFGVRSAEMPRELTDYVLGPFSGDEAARLGTLVERAAEVCEVWAKEGFAAAQSRLSRLQSKT